MTSELQLKPKARHMFWAGHASPRNHRNFKLTSTKIIPNRADGTPPPSNSVNAGGVVCYCLKAAKTTKSLLTISLKLLELKSMQNRTDHKVDSSSKKSAFEYFTEIIGWTQIMLSPLLLSVIFGAIIYFPKPSEERLFIAALIVFAGLIIGAIWATRVWKKKGTISFMSSIMSNPKPDPKDEEPN